MTLPNRLTLLRIGLIPILIIVFYLPFAWKGPAAATLFLACSITDWLDGFLARKLDQTSDFGRFLDPVADKLLIAVTLILLVEKNPTPFLAIPAIIIIGREITVSALREWMAELGEGPRVAVSTIGKMKTAMQMTALVLLLYQEDLFDLPLFLIGEVLLYLAMALTIWSLVVYLKAAWPTFSEKSS